MSRVSRAKKLPDRLRPGEIPVSPRLTELLLRATEILRELLAAANAGTNAIASGVRGRVLPLHAPAKR